MSKLLKAIAAKHRPHIAAKMNAANDYDETKHTHAKHLRSAGIIDKAELDDLTQCLDDLSKGGSSAANYLKNGKDSGKLNDADFVRAMMAADSDVGDDDPTGDDDLA